MKSALSWLVKGLLVASVVGSDGLHEHDVLSLRGAKSSNGLSSVARRAVEVPLAVPFTVGAIDYTNFRKTDDIPNGDCDTGTKVDAGLTADDRCLSEDGRKCFVGWNEPTDVLAYEFVNEKSGVYEVKVTLGSVRTDKSVKLTIPGVGDKTFNGPGDGWESFKEYVWNVALPEGDFVLLVEFLEGKVNLCSVSVEKPFILTVPFTTSALDYTGYQKSDNERNGDCYTGTAVDAATTTDKRCLSEDGRKCFVGWNDPKDFLAYDFVNPQAGTFDIKVTLGSVRTDKSVKLVLIKGGEVVSEKVFNGPGDGWRTFEEYAWPVFLTEGDYVLIIEFLDGQLNLCSVGIENNESCGAAVDMAIEAFRKELCDSGYLISDFDQPGCRDRLRDELVL